MNVAGALARGMDGGTPNFGSVELLLIEAVRSLPALATASGEADEGAEIPFNVATGGVSVDEVVSFLMNPLFADLARPVALSEFVSFGRAGLPLFSEEEVDAFLSDVPERDPGYARSWLEFAPMDADRKSWVAYPQTLSTSVEFLLILPVVEDARFTRFLFLATGLDVKTGVMTQAPRVERETGCDPVVTGVGLGLSQKCRPSTCQHECEPGWQTQRGPARLTGCECKVGS